MDPEFPDPPPGLHHDIEYHLDPLIFQVGGSIFRVPREYFAQESTFFLDLFQLAQPASEEHGSEGTVDTTPLTLPDTISEYSFRAFLKLLYSNAPSASNLTKEEWTAVLELARMWDMSTIRNIVVRHLGPLLEDDPAQKWSLAKTYEVHDWVRPALEKLVRRNEPLGEREFQILDQETMLKIAAIRESCYPFFRDSDPHYGYYGGPDMTITRWEIRHERQIHPQYVNFWDSVTFTCPSPQLIYDTIEDTAQDTDNWKKNAEFYFERIVFRVGDRLYRVPNQPFAQHSPVFRSHFEKRGFVKYDCRDPYVIEAGVSATDFDNLLRFFFPPKSAGERETTQEEWASVLRLSARWGMEELKTLAVQRLTQRDFGNIQTKLQVAQELGVQDWFLSGMRALVVRQEPPTAAECQVLSQAHVLQVFDLRERVHS